MTRGDLEGLIDRVRAEVTDPVAGLYGPGSSVWQLNRENMLFLGGGKAALLQLAHPWVAHAIDQHSAIRSDPLGRFQRTFESVFGVMFGDLDRALKVARRVHAMHSGVRGEIREDVGAYKHGDRYHANHEEAALWVYATLIETAVHIYDLVVAPLDAGARERYYQESKRFAHLFGISDRVLPKDWPAFIAYYEGMLDSDVIHAGDSARELARFLFSARDPARRLSLRWLRAMTAGLLPPRVREEFRLPYGTVQRGIYRASLAVLPAVHRALPAKVRFVPAYLEAERRLAERADLRAVACRG